MPRTEKMRIFLDSRYPDIIERTSESLLKLYPTNKVAAYKHPGENCVDVRVHSQRLIEDFPQHGPGPKHNRKIELHDWQVEIIKDCPLEFFTGLYHSDGCRDANIVNGKSYPRYSFSNKSEDIKRIFEWVCDLLEISYTRSSSGKTISIARREDVNWLDQLVGPKS